MPNLEDSIKSNPLALSQLQGSGLNRADLAGLFGATMQLNPYMAGLGALSAAPSVVQAIKQEKLLKDLQKKGPQDVTPQAFKEYQSFLQSQANNAKIAGYGSALENISRAQSAGLGNVYKTAINPAQALRGALALNQQGIQARTQLDIQGAQAQQARQAAANQAMLQRGQFQEKGRQEYNAAVSALRGAKAQNWNNFIQGLAGAGLNSFVIGKPNQTTPETPETPESVTNQIPTGADLVKSKTQGFTTPYSSYGNFMKYKDIPYEDTLPSLGLNNVAPSAATPAAPAPAPVAQAPVQATPSPASAAPVAPVPQTPAPVSANLDRRPTSGTSTTYRLTMPPVGKDNFYSQPYIMQQRDGSSVVFETDGNATMVSKNGVERKGKYLIKDGQIQFTPED